MQRAFTTEEIFKKLSRENPYEEFLRVPTMSAGIYQLNQGDVDRQQPHTEDEIYYVLEGEAEIQVGDQNHEVREGSIIFVEAHLEHRFHSIKKDLKVLVFFSLAEYSLRGNE